MRFQFHNVTSKYVDGHSPTTPSHVASSYAASSISRGPHSSTTPISCAHGHSPTTPSRVVDQKSVSLTSHHSRAFSQPHSRASDQFTSQSHSHANAQSPNFMTRLDSSIHSASFNNASHASSFHRAQFPSSPQRVQLSTTRSVPSVLTQLHRPYPNSTHAMTTWSKNGIF